MRNEHSGDGRVTYIGPRSFIVGFAIVCALFLAILGGATRLAGSLEPPLPPDASIARLASAPPAAASDPNVQPTMAPPAMQPSASAPSLPRAIATRADKTGPAAVAPRAPHVVATNVPRKPHFPATTWLAVKVLRAIPAPVLGIFHVRVNPIWIARTSPGTPAMRHPRAAPSPKVHGPAPST